MRSLPPPSHPSGLNDRVVAKVVARRGRQHAFESLVPSRTALVVIDLDTSSVTQDDNCRAMVPRINRLARELRALDGYVAWVLPKFVVDDVSVAIYGREAAERFAAGTAPEKSQLWPELEPAEGDLHSTKIGASAFFPGKCDLSNQLTERGIETLLMTGTVTNVCVESSARDAVELGFKVTLISDACAGHAHGQHEATLLTFYRNFGDVRPVDEAIVLLKQARETK